MERVVLDPLGYIIERSVLLGRLHVREGSGHAGKIDGLIREARDIARPKAVYRMACIAARGERHVTAGNVRFQSRVLAVNLERQHRFFAFVVTAGRELASWADGKTDLLDRFWADAISQAVVISGRASLERHLQKRFDLAKTARMSPGSLPDWPLEEQRNLFELLGDTAGAIGVELTESCLMVPVKSLSGILFENEEGYANCRLCPRDDCPGRNAPYDPDLYERRYRNTGEGRQGNSRPDADPPIFD